MVTGQKQQNFEQSRSTFNNRFT